MADSSDSDDDIPLSQRGGPPAKVEVKVAPKPPVKIEPPKQAPPKRTVEASPTSEAKKPKPSASGEKDSAKRKEAPPSTSSTNGHGVPAAKAPKPAPTKKKVPDSDSESSDVDDKPLSMRRKEPVAAPAKPKSDSKKHALVAPAKVKAEKASPRAKPAMKAIGEPSRDTASLGDEEKWYEQEGIEKLWKRGGVKWNTLVHGGVWFPPPYVAHGKPLIYDGRKIVLNNECEEVASMFAHMKDTDYGKNKAFQDNFMGCWRKLLRTSDEGKPVREFEKCDFSAIAEHLAMLNAMKKERTKEEKAAEKKAKDEMEAPFVFAMVDGRKEKVGNFRVEPPGLFRGRGDHPKMGNLKSRIFPEDVTLNLSECAPVPPVPDLGDGIVHKWKEIVHSNTVTWLAKWRDSINGEDKQVFLAPNSAFKGISDMAKYEKARKLKNHIDQVRKDYTKGMKSSDVAQQQQSVAVYLIDRLALRVGNEKDTDEEADTVGCCSLRVEHVFLDKGENQLHLCFLGKDSIEYNNTTTIIPEVFALFKQFIRGKKPDADVFEHVGPASLNTYFHTIMEGLSAKVFRTYNASITLDAELQKTSREVTEEHQQKEGVVNAFYNYYNIANKNVAELCNHQRATAASHGPAMQKIDDKIAKLQEELADARKAKNAAKVDGLKKRIDKTMSERMIKDETKNVSLGTSKINYNDPRITVAWCKRHDVPIQKPFPKTLMSKFTWAMAVDPEYRF